MRFTVGSLLTLILLLSCQKELNFDTPQTGNQACKACSYIPFCDGSLYVYSDTILGIGSNVTETLVIEKDTTIDGKVFQKFSNAGADGYYNCSSGISTFIAFNIPLPGGDLPRLEQILLKANSPVGTTWSNSFSVGFGTADFTYTLAGKGLTKILLGVRYNDVIHVRGVLSSTIPGGGTVIISEDDYFYANNIGLIEQITFSSSIVGPPAVVYHRVLKTYSIP